VWGEAFFWAGKKGGKWVSFFRRGRRWVRWGKKGERYFFLLLMLLKGESFEKVWEKKEEGGGVLMSEVEGPGGGGVDLGGICKGGGDAGRLGGGGYGLGRELLWGLSFRGGRRGGGRRFSMGGKGVVLCLRGWQKKGMGVSFFLL